MMVPICLLAMLYCRMEIYILKLIVQSNVGLSLSTKGASSILINGDLPEVHALRTW